MAAALNDEWASAADDKSSASISSLCVTSGIVTVSPVVSLAGNKHWDTLKNFNNDSSTGIFSLTYMTTITPNRSLCYDTTKP